MSGDSEIDRLALEEQKCESGKKCCEKCESVFPNRLRKCPVCSATLVPTRSMANRVSDLSLDRVIQFKASEETFPENPKEIPEAIIHDPCMVNPNSWDRVEQVLEHLEALGMTNGREWLEVVCDGVPYTMIAKRIFANPEQFQWLLLRPGIGHIEINAFKSVFKLTWNIFMESLAQLLCFQSEKALNYARNAKDHHKTWEMVLVAVHGTTEELMVPYVKRCEQIGIEPSVSGFETYVADSDDSTLELTFNVLKKMISILALRTGVRRNNHDLTTSARLALQPLWLAFNHPKYRLLEF